MHPRVVGDADDHAAVDARIGGCKKRVRRDVQTDMLHRAEGTRAANGRAERGLARDLLIRRPFRINFLILARIFGNFSRRRSRIARHKPASRLKKSPGNCLIAQHQLFHLTPLSGFFEKKPRQKTFQLFRKKASAKNFSRLRRKQRGGRCVYAGCAANRASDAAKPKTVRIFTAGRQRAWPCRKTARSSLAGRA